MLRRMEFKTIALDTREGHLNTDRIYQTGYLLYEIDTNMGKFSDGEHHFKDLPYFNGGEIPTPESSFKGLWNSETEYKEGDIVFDENGIYYLVISNVIGEIPSTSSSYLPLNSKEPTSDTAYKGDYSSDKEYSKGDYVFDNNNFYISINDNPGGIPLTDTNYWKDITDDHLVTMKYLKKDIEAKVCLTTININDCNCECEPNSRCKCHTGIDDIKLSKDFSPTVNLKTGEFKIPGVLIPEGGVDGFIDETSFNELVERVRILEEKITELENRLN